MLDHRIEAYLRRGEFFSLLRRSRELNAGARPHDVDRGQANEQCQGCDNLEVNDRFERQTAHRFHVIGVTGDSYHQRRKNERHNDAFDQVQENGGNEFEVQSGLWKQPAQENPGHHRQDNPSAERDAAEQCNHSDVMRRRW